MVSKVLSMYIVLNGRLYEMAKKSCRSSTTDLNILMNCRFDPR